MTPAEANHRACTVLRIPAYAELFGGKPVEVFPFHQLRCEEDSPFFVDVFVYALQMEGVEGPVVAAVTNGMSDQRMAEGDDPEQPRRRELIQYFRKCTRGHAKWLHSMAWAPLEDEFLLDTHHSIAWEWPAVEGTPWKNAFFLEPLLRSHRAFSVEVQGDPVSFLWPIPISDEERAYKKEHGSDALIDRLQEVKLPWIFDETNRPALLP
jgi:hypothetical protein